MTKKPLELVAFADRIAQHSFVLETTVNRNELEAKIYCKNAQWGLPKEILEDMNNPPMNECIRIADFSGISELEKGDCHITLYFEKV